MNDAQLTFYGRQTELVRLRERFSSPAEELVIVSGRRRVGKSRLLLEAATGFRAISYQAIRSTVADNLNDFRAAAGKVLGQNAALDGISTWEGIIDYIASRSDPNAGIVLILDEFPYLVEQDASLPSVLQRLWDNGRIRAGHLKIVLCGSTVAQMGHLVSAREPLHGRATMHMTVEPLPLREAAEFLPWYSAEDVITAYGVLGGIPYYLNMVEPEWTLDANLIRLLFSDGGRLIEEPGTFMAGSLRQPAVYNAILGAIANGCVMSSDIADRIREKPTALGPYLERLIELLLIRKVRSLDAVPKQRNIRFEIVDPLMRFWYAFVLPNRMLIARGKGDTVLAGLRTGALQTYMGHAFELICRGHIELHSEEHFGEAAREVGQVSGHADFDIDVAGTLQGGRQFFGECKWTTQPVSQAELAKLRTSMNQTRYRDERNEACLALFSRSGFTDGLMDAVRDDPAISLVGLDALAFGEGHAYASRPRSRP